ncbi:MAG: TetR/AcrR family transcriptional regulator [Anaerolineae bacterium]
MSTERQLSRRERKKRETRASLMEAALRLFQENGYDATTVKDITDAAGVAKGTFFNYFDTKEAILPAIAGRRLEQLEEALTPEQGAPASPVARIKLALRLVAEDPLCERHLAERLFAAIMAHREINPGHALRDLLTEQVRQAQAAGEIRDDLDPVYLASALRSLFFQQLAMWHHGHRPAPLPTLIDASVDLLMDGAAGRSLTRSS